MLRTIAFLYCAVPLAAITCDTSAYKPQPGLTAQAGPNGLTLQWQGAPGHELRATLDIVNGQPLIREISARRTGAAWAALGRDLTPEFEVVSGVRRISNQQLSPLRDLGLTSPEILEREKWKAFWDAPLEVPGSASTNPGLPRRPEEIRRASANYNISSCRVSTDGARIEAAFPGLVLGIFSGQLVFTIYKGSNLLRQEAAASTNETSAAYKYNAGLKGFRTDYAKRITWRDTARAWQKYEFGGEVNNDPVTLRARNRLAIVEAAQGSLAIFPPPHKFFWAREIELNLGYVWYRKDTQDTFSAGIRNAENEEMFRPYGISDELWDRRVRQARNFAKGNFALYNAPAGTLQRMAVYYHLSPDNARAAHTAVMAYTHDDTYKPLPGHQVAVSHFHTHFNEFLLDRGTFDARQPWIDVFKSLGINIAMMSDFHSDSHPKDPGPLRFKEQHAYFEGSKRHSDTDFLIMPGEEPDAWLGGHYTAVFPRPVYWTHVRAPGQPLVENHPTYGKVYHAGSAADELEIIKAEGGLVWQAHPRTKGSSGYPESIKDTPHFRSEHYLGAAYQSLPVDLSEPRICEVRCFGTLDDMNNWGAPKYQIAEGDTYNKFPDDDTYGHLMVNYVKLDKLPRANEDWSPILKAMRAGDFFVTSGEVLIRSFSVEGAGPNRTVNADIEWTFPLEFVEVVWGDGKTTGRQIVRATHFAPFSTNRFKIPINAAGKKWVRFAAWDAAGNGAASQPVHLR